MENVTKTYRNIPETMVEELINDLRIDLRDVPTFDWKSYRESDGNFTVSVKICKEGHVGDRYV